MIREQKRLLVLAAELLVDGAKLGELELSVPGAELMAVALGDQPLDRGGERRRFAGRLVRLAQWIWVFLGCGRVGGGSLLPVCRPLLIVAALFSDSIMTSPLFL